MITIKDIDNAMSAVCPKTLSEEWDNDGIMLCGDKQAPVTKVLVMLEVTPDGVEHAVKGGFDLIITHHPLIFKPLKSLTDGNFCLFGKLMQHGISVLSYHTRLDSAEGGVNDAAMNLMRLTNIRPFGGENGVCGRVGVLQKPVKPEEFALQLKTCFGAKDVRASLFKTNNRTIQTVAFVGGAGKSFFYDAYLAGADAFVTGEAAHNTFLDCKELDMCLFDIGHYASENPVCDRIKGILEDRFSSEISVEVFDVTSPFTVF